MEEGFDGLTYEMVLTRDILILFEPFNDKIICVVSTIKN